MNIKINRMFQSNLLWKVFSYFLSHPSDEIYVKELAKLLKVGPTSANNTLQSLEKMGLLQRQERARSHFYSLDNESAAVKSLKIAYFLTRLEDAKLVEGLTEADQDMISLCVYGSFADGTFDKNSDLDLLIISQKDKPVFNSAVTEFENMLGLEVNIEVFTLHKWKRVKEEDKGFYREVMASHILLYGSDIF